MPASLFVERTGFPLTLVQLELDHAERRGLIERDHLHIKPTLLGRRFLNDLQALFLPQTTAKSKASEAAPLLGIEP